MSAYLDGNLVEEGAVVPGKHLFIGTFRAPFPPNHAGTAAVVVCPCGRFLETTEGVRQHWQEGHFDIPVYRTEAA